MNSSFFDFHTFTWNARGFSYEVQGACNAAKEPVNCSVLFDNKTNIVTQFGKFGQKEFDPDPDIAGIGVSLHSMSPIV